MEYKTNLGQRDFYLFTLNYMFDLGKASEVVNRPSPR